MKNLETWVKGLLAAVIGGASNAVSAVLVAPGTFNFSHDGVVAIAKLAAAGAFLSAVMYLKQSPVPKDNGQ